MSMIRETDSTIGNFQTLNIASGKALASTVSAKTFAANTGPLDVSITNLSLPVQITNLSALEITSGQLNAAIRAPTAATNEILMTTPHPTIQMDFFNGIDACQVRHISGGTITASNGLLSISGNGGYACLESQRVQPYRAGQSMQARIGAQFVVAGPGLAYAGPINAESGCAVGFKDKQFGFFRREGGTRQINVLEITGTFIPLTGYDITLNGAASTITVGGTAVEVANQIAKLNWAPNVTGFHGYTVMPKSADAYFLAHEAALKSGTFASTITGPGFSSSFTTLVDGIVPTDTFVPQNAWNVDTLDGLIGSAFELDPGAGNVYNIAYQAVGYGAHVLQVMDPKAGVWVTAHRENNTPPAFNPRTPLQFYASLKASVQGTSASAFIDGDFQLLGPTYSASRLAFKAGASAGQWHSVFSIRNDPVFNNRANYKLVNLTHLTAKVCRPGVSLCLLRLVKNMVLETATYQSVAHGASIVSVDYTDNVQQDQPANFVIASGDSTVITFSQNQFILNPGDVLTLAFQPQINGDYNIAATLSWIEN